MKFHFFGILMRMKYINRWGLMRNTYPENIQQHSSETAILAHAIAKIGNIYFGKSYDSDRAATLALYHDANEILTGDLPTPVKYLNPSIMTAYKQVETEASKQLLSMLPEELLPEYESYFLENEDDKELWKLVKAADKLSAYIKCVEERKAGNSEFKEAENATLNAIKALKLSEVDKFMELFAPSFELSLDEQKR
ncbi:MAG: 5'-deoxynucleotidase [Ruminococcaceae bacterium]|nr:5'-deoxynucleotidase [Oscillospiraceae bacterium]